MKCRRIFKIGCVDFDSDSVGVSAMFDASRRCGTDSIMRATRKDIAKATGVSLSTVGMILGNSGGRYSAETRKRVIEAAERMGYQTSINAKALRLQRSLLLGVLFSDLNTHHASSFLRGVKHALLPTEYSPLVFFNDSEADQESSLDHCLNRGVDALLLNCTVDPQGSRAKEFAKRVASLKIPVMEFFGSQVPGMPRVDIDNDHTGWIATRYLQDQGHERIALLTHSRYKDRKLHRDACEIAEGYHRAMAEKGLEPKVFAMKLDYEQLTHADFARAGGECLRRLDSAKPTPTAVVCYNDPMAYGLLRACDRAGIRVPDDLSVIGNNDLNFSALVDPPLSTVKLDAFKVGFEGANRLLAAIDGKPLVGESVKTELVLRESTSPLPVLGA
jgi:LacI family transcriptional regulator